ncbi:unnamed protein product [Mycetohabitans rhizoxinica HKI 454]|uniref:Uncharacterized protein n=1 Tax=Mycetohabitans rhizoxinica (strain DSM 19002 / CIP 109453 / HKI 454) TaxID=882378 RepID=E5AR48_MYCRK|nr:unnamed protein product [Mycetohabitans rhizoxinica HKI 454]
MFDAVRALLWQHGMGPFESDREAGRIMALPDAWNSPRLDQPMRRIRGSRGRRCSAAHINPLLGPAIRIANRLLFRTKIIERIKRI